MFEILIKRIKRNIERFKTGGFRGIGRAISYKLFILREKRAYQDWIKESDEIFEARRELIRKEIESFENQPLISVLMPVYNVDEKWLRLCIESVLAQIYENWELCIADDCSSKPHIRRILEEYQGKDARIRVDFRKENGHISAASNSALAMAEGEFAVLLDHDDELTGDALFYIAKELNEFPQTAMIYSDEDLIDQMGRRYEPKFKPDWSPDLFYSMNLITHLSAYRTNILRKIGGFKLGLEGSQDYDLALRVIEEIKEAQIRHIPRILYHWRAISGSVAFDSGEKPYAHERARQAIREHFERIGVKASVANGWQTLHRVSYDWPEKASFEVFSAEDASAAKFNLRAEGSKADVFIFAEGGIEALDEGSFRELAAFAFQDKIGAAGGKILNQDGSIRNAGVILGLDGLLGFANRRNPDEFAGFYARAAVIGNFSAVSGILAIRRELFKSFGGFDAVNFNKGLYEIDLCLRLLAGNYRIVYTPYASFLQRKKSSTEKIVENPGAKEALEFRKKWAKVIDRDPYFNPNLKSERFGLIPGKFPR